jgi:UDP-3-O-[3-hydroxymyristoyl] glucosamine N-acyltransferase
MEWNIESILSGLEISYNSQGANRTFKSLSSLSEASENDLSFSYDEGERAISAISKSNAGIILCSKSIEGLVYPRPRKQALFFLANPRLTFVRIMNQVYCRKKMVGISPRAVISETANIGSDCYVGDYSIVGENCTIGDNTIVHAKVVLMENCTIGNGCIIRPGVTMGAEGFAFERGESGYPERFPHIRGIRVENDVEIFPNCNIAKGSLSDTVIGEGTRIGALTSIAHNVTIGKKCLITSCTTIGGSTSIGDMCWTGLNSTIKNRIRIGNNVIVAAGAVVIHDVPDKEIVGGIPARSIKGKVTSKALYRMAGLITST